MKRILLLAAALLVFGDATVVVAADYLIHFEQAGYENAPVEAAAPRDEILSSLQIVARTGERYYGRSTHARSVLTVKGQLKPAKNGLLKLSIQCSNFTEQPEFTRTREGAKRHLFNTQEMATEIDVKLNQKVRLGGIEPPIGPATDQPVGASKSNATRTKRVYSVRVTEFDPDQQSPEEVVVADQKRLQGIWHGVEVTQDGVAVEDYLVKQLDFRFEVDRLVWQGTEPKFGKRRFEFQLDASTSPKTMHLTPLDGQFKGQSMPAIYDLSTGDLILCLPDFEAPEQPDKLESPNGSKRKLFRLSK